MGQKSREILRGLKNKRFVIFCTKIVVSTFKIVQVAFKKGRALVHRSQVKIGIIFHFTDMLSA